MKYEKSCGAMIFMEKNEERQYLLVLNQKSAKAGHWGFPKGHIEPGETEEETAHREILEETGLQVQLFSGFRKVSHYSPRPGVDKEVVYFLAQPMGEEIKLQETEISAYRWCNAEEAVQLLSHDADVELLLRAEEFLR